MTRPRWPMTAALRPALMLAAPLLAAAGLTACTPTFDWRELRPADSGAVAMFPCRPASHAREVLLAGHRVRLTMHACSAGDSTWAQAWADLEDPARIGPALEELRAAAAANLAAGAGRALPLQVEGTTPSPAMQRVAFEGRLPDGKAAQEQVALFAKGLRVYQATALGAKLQAEAAETFFGGLKTP